MDEVKKLRSEILEKVREYYRLAHAHLADAPFVPGSSRVNYAGRVYDEAELVNTVDAGLDFWLTYGRYSKDFELRLAEYLGVKYALFVNSGSSANLLAFSALTSPLLGDRRIRRGDEVITVACAFPTTVAPIVQYGAVPVFVDVEAGTANIDASRLEAALSPRTKAVMIAHTLGNPFDVKAVKSFCDRHGLWLVEDNCDALGSRYRGKLTGTFGDIGTSSFYPTHHLTTGEGGAVYARNETLHGILLSLRDWGRDCHCPTGRDNCCGQRFSGQYGTLPPGYDHKYVYRHFGGNFKMTDLQAAIGCAQLK
ncbi:MAG: lipopolysaccharide biosynthesis protein RfbH, partial [Lentisphaeria bacterium]|nr:lipopolysaccharide biosynthesis protein RfbH [Lentisphaeria bacterium]